MIYTMHCMSQRPILQRVHELIIEILWKLIWSNLYFGDSSSHKFTHQGSWTAVTCAKLWPASRLFPCKSNAYFTSLWIQFTWILSSQKPGETCPYDGQFQSAGQVPHMRPSICTKAHRFRYQLGKQSQQSWQKSHPKSQHIPHNLHSKWYNFKHDYFTDVVEKSGWVKSHCAL